MNTGIFDVTAYGAAGNGTDDDIEAFEHCTADAVSHGGSIYIPPVPSGRYYRLKRSWTFSKVHEAFVFGAGIRSLIVIDNQEGRNAITVDGCLNLQIKDLGISGVTGSGHGIELTNDSLRPLISNVWIGWVDGDGIHVTKSMSGRLDGVRIYQNDGFDPAGLGAARGNIRRGLYVTGRADFRNNNWSAVNCQIEACGRSSCNLQVGDDTAPVDSFAWFGGLIQGSNEHREVVLRTRDALIAGTHIEPPAGASPNYVVTLDRCQNTRVVSGSLQGDVRMVSCIQSGVEHVRGSGFDIDGGCIDCFVRDSDTRHIVTGPTGGYVRDRGSNTELSRVTMASAASGGYGYWNQSARLHTTRFADDWDRSAGRPSGWSIGSGGRYTQVNARSGGLRVQLNDDSHRLLRSFGPIEALRGRTITVDIRLSNAINAAPLVVHGIYNGGARTVAIPTSFSAGAQERLQAAFRVGSDDTSFRVALAGAKGTDAVIHQIDISVTGFTPAVVGRLTGSTAESLGEFGYPLATYIDAGSTTNLVRFTDAFVGVPFTIHFTGARTLIHSPILQLSGERNFQAAPGAAITILPYDSGDATVFKELSRR